MNTPTVIDGDDFIAATRDARVAKLLADAKAYADMLQRTGRDHSRPIRGCSVGKGRLALNQD